MSAHLSIPADVGLLVGLPADYDVAITAVIEDDGHAARCIVAVAAQRDDGQLAERVDNLADRSPIVYQRNERERDVWREIDPRAENV